MQVLAFDQSVKSTVAVLLADNSTTPGPLELRSQWTHEPKGSGIYRMVGFKSWMESIVCNVKPDLFVREMHNQRTWGAASQLHGLAALMDYCAWEINFLDRQRYAIVPNTSWKKFCLSRGNFKKDTAYLIHMNRFFNSTILLDGDTHNVLNDNVADAMCLGIYGYVAYVTHIMKQDIPGLFEYQKESLKKVATVFDYGAG